MRLRQIRGPALGIFQIEPATHKDVHDNYLNARPDQRAFIKGLASWNGPVIDLIGNLPYQAAIARIVYWRKEFVWPKKPDDLLALGTIWNDYYNCNPDHGTPRDFINAFPMEALLR